jgi:hypothetical protein
MKTREAQCEISGCHNPAYCLAEVEIQEKDGKTTWGKAFYSKIYFCLDHDADRIYGKLHRVKLAGNNSRIWKPKTILA